MERLIVRAGSGVGDCALLRIWLLELMDPQDFFVPTHIYFVHLITLYQFHIILYI